MPRKGCKMKKIAELVSFIFNPFFMILSTVVLGIERSNFSERGLILATLFVLLFNGVLPLYFYYELLKKNIIIDDILDNKEALKNRPLILGWGTILFFFETIFVKVFSHSRPLFYTFLILTLLTLVVFIISFYRKISLHMSYATLFALALIYVLGPSSWPILLIIPLIGWSRYILMRHTLKQLLAGFLVTTFISFLFYILIS